MAVSEASCSTDENKRDGCALQLVEDDTAAVRAYEIRSIKHSPNYTGTE